MHDYDADTKQIDDMRYIPRLFKFLAQKFLWYFMILHVKKRVDYAFRHAKIYLIIALMIF